MTKFKHQDNQERVPVEQVKQNMQDRYLFMLDNGQYNGRYADEIATLEEFVTDTIDDGSDEQERLEQEASNRVLMDWATADTESGERSGGSRSVVGAVPPAPGLVTRGYLCNSPPHSALSGSIEVTPEIKHGGFDGGAKNCFFGTWNQEAFTTLIGSLESGKTRAVWAQHCNSDSAPEPDIMTLAGRDVSISPSGSRIGVYYAYHICFEGYDVFIHQDMTPKNGNPQIWVDYRAESILKYGSLYGAQSVLLDFLSKLGFTKFEKNGERVSRLDIQVMIDVPVREFANLYLADHDVSKARDFRINGKKKQWGKQIETFETGSIARLQLCIYDKRTEILKKMNKETAAKYAKTIENIGEEWWNSDRPITRIEFRLSRDALRALGVDSLEDFRRRERAIVEYLTHDWFRLLKKKKVRGTENDAAVHPLWERVRSLFFQYFSCDEVPEVKWEKPTRISIDSEALNKQGMGCLLGAVASIYGAQQSVSDLRNRVVEVVPPSVNEETLEKYNRRVRRIEVEKGVEFGKYIAHERAEHVKALERFDNPVLRLRR